MKRLKHLTPKEMLYTILIHYDDNGQYIDITITQRIIVKFKYTPQENAVKMLVEPIEHKSFVQSILFSDKEDLYVFKSRGMSDTEFIYCFSRESFMNEIKQAVKNCKEIIHSKNIIDTTNVFCQDFMPKLIKLMNSNKSGFVYMTF